MLYFGNDLILANANLVNENPDQVLFTTISDFNSILDSYDIPYYFVPI